MKLSIFWQKNEFDNIQNGVQTFKKDLDCNHYVPFKYLTKFFGSEKNHFFASRKKIKFNVLPQKKLNLLSWQNDKIRELKDPSNFEFQKVVVDGGKNCFKIV